MHLEFRHKAQNGEKLEIKIKMNNNKGMVTIEACIIIPVILSISVLLMWMGLYYYNQTVIANAASVAAIEGARCANKSNDEISSISREKAEALLSERLISMDEVGISVIVEYGLVTVTIKGNMSVPGFLVMGDVYDESGWGINIAREAPRLRNAEFIRTIVNIRDTVSENQAQ